MEQAVEWVPMVFGPANLGWLMTGLLEAWWWQAGCAVAAGVWLLMGSEVGTEAEAGVWFLSTFVSFRPIFKVRER